MIAAEAGNRSGQRGLPVLQCSEQQLFLVELMNRFGKAFDVLYQRRQLQEVRGGRRPQSPTRHGTDGQQHRRHGSLLVSDDLRCARYGFGLPSE